TETRKPVYLCTARDVILEPMSFRKVKVHTSDNSRPARSISFAELCSKKPIDTPRAIVDFNNNEAEVWLLNMSYEPQKLLQNCKVALVVDRADAFEEQSANKNILKYD